MFRRGIYLTFVGHIRMHVAFATGLGQSDLFLPLAEAFLVLIRGLGNALMTGHAFFEFSAVFVFGQDRAAASMARGSPDK